MNLRKEFCIALTAVLAFGFLGGSASAEAGSTRRAEIYSGPIYSLAQEKTMSAEIADGSTPTSLGLQIDSTPKNGKITNGDLKAIGNEQRHTGEVARSCLMH